MVRLVIRIQIRHAEPSSPLLHPLKIGTTGITGEAQPPRQGRGVGRRSPPRAGPTTVDGENGKIIGGKLSFLQAISRNSISSVTELSNTETFRNLSPSSFLLNSCLAQFFYISYPGSPRIYSYSWNRAFASSLNCLSLACVH